MGRRKFLLVGVRRRRTSSSRSWWGGFEGRGEFRLIQRSKFFACGSGNRPNGEDKLSREMKGTGIEKGIRIISVF